MGPLDRVEGERRERDESREKCTAQQNQYKKIGKKKKKILLCDEIGLNLETQGWINTCLQPCFQPKSASSFPSTV